MKFLLFLLLVTTISGQYDKRQFDEKYNSTKIFDKNSHFFHQACFCKNDDFFEKKMTTDKKTTFLNNF